MNTLRGSGCLAQRSALALCLAKRQCLHSPGPLTAIRQLQTLVYRHNIHNIRPVHNVHNIHPVHWHGIRWLSASPPPSSKKRAVDIGKYPNTLAGRNQKVQDSAMWCVSVVILMLGVTFASVPLYKMFCSTTGYGGTTSHELAGEKVADMEAVRWRPVTVRFSTMVDSGLEWEFTPVQDTVELVPGETCLAFFTAKNLTDKPITGVSVYNVTPFAAGSYFNKIQCFCFDEQRLNAHEEIDMPVFFYIDPDFALDTELMREQVREVTLHYIFFDTEYSKDEHHESPIAKEFKKLYRAVLPEWLIGVDLEQYRPTPETDLRNPANR